jgi:plasmid stability protein
MKNITLAMDEKVLRAVRRYAAEHDTTVNALVRDYLTGLVDFEDRAAKARAELVEMAKKSKARLGPNWKWNREDIYADRMLPRHQRTPLRRGGKG